MMNRRPDREGEHCFFHEKRFFQEKRRKLQIEEIPANLQGKFIQSGQLLHPQRSKLLLRKERQFLLPNGRQCLIPNSLPGKKKLQRPETLSRHTGNELKRQVLHLEEEKEKGKEKETV